MITLAQETFIPDSNFESFLENNGLGNGVSGDSYVLTSSIETVNILDVQNKFITNLTGIEDFTALITLRCDGNFISSLDFSSNIFLSYLSCDNNILSSLNVSSNSTLSYLHCSSNNLTNLDLFYNISISDLSCNDNLISNLDLSNSFNLNEINCSNNALTNLLVNNGNNGNITYFNCTNNPNLLCVDVDDPNYSSSAWTNIDSQTNFNLNCSTAFGCLDPQACNYDSVAVSDGEQS